MSTEVPQFVPGEVPMDARLGIVAARFNVELVEALLEGCRSRLEELGVSAERVVVHRVPGAFEIPLTCRAMAATGRYAAIIALGAVVRGETPHFEYVAGECARGVAEVALAERVPVIFGVLTTNTPEQAWDRCGGKHGHAGQRAAEAAMEMIAVLRRIGKGEQV